MGLSRAHAGELLEVSVAKRSGLGSSPRFLGLFTDAGVEATYPGYARVAVPGTAWVSAVEGVVRNGDEVLLVKPTSGPDVQIIAGGLFMDATGGAAIHTLDVVAFLISSSDVAPKFIAGMLELSIDGA